MAANGRRHSSLEPSRRVQAEHIPTELAKLNRWHNWTAVHKPERDKWTKPPVGEQGPLSSALASCSETLGLGVRLGQEGDGLWLAGIDLDDCCDPETGTVEPWAQLIVDHFKTYSERSPSKTGIKMLGWVKQRFRSETMGCGAGTLEAYSDGRYFTFTGDRVGTSELRDVSAEWESFLSERKADEKRVLNTLAEDLRPYPMQRQPDAHELKEALKFVPADDYSTWLYVGMALKNDGYDISWWIGWSQTSSKFEEGICERKWESFADRPEGWHTSSIAYWARQNGWYWQNRWEPLTDVGNAITLANLGEGKLKHSTELGWLKWDGMRWTAKDAFKAAQEMQEKAIQVRLSEAQNSLIRHMLSDNSAKDFEEKLKAKTKTVIAVRRFQDNKHIQGALQLATSKPKIAFDYEKLDQHQMLLNCLNGTLNLETMQLQPHDPRDLLTQLCPHNYNPIAPRHRWEQFLREVFPQHLDVIPWLHRYLGYCLTADVRHHIMPVFIGGGRNGKSTLLETMQYVLGEDYSDITPQHFLELTKSERHPTELMDLRAKRFVCDIETDEGAKLNEARMKRLTGGDTLKARHMKKDFVKFKPTYKFVLATNHEPRITGIDDAVWQRLKRVPFDEKFPNGDPKQDTRLKESGLFPEAEGILAWLTEGCAAWMKDGLLSDPESVKVSTDSYREEQNPIKEFFEEQFIKKEGASVLKKTVTAMWEAWRDKRRIPSVSNKMFGTRFRALSGATADDGGHKYVGIEVQKN